MGTLGNGAQFEVTINVPTILTYRLGAGGTKGARGAKGQDALIGNGGGGGEGGTGGGGGASILMFDSPVNIEVTAIVGNSNYKYSNVRSIGAYGGDGGIVGNGGDPSPGGKGGKGRDGDVGENDEGYLMTEGGAGGDGGPGGLGWNLPANAQETITIFGRGSSDTGGINSQELGDDGILIIEKIG
jgi:hypothetical protein